MDCNVLPPPQASPRKQGLTAQGIIDLTSEPTFRPIHVNRDPNGKWVIRYYLFDALAASTFAQQNQISSHAREFGLHTNSVQPFTPEQRLAMDRIIRRIEGVCQVRFERVANADQ